MARRIPRDESLARVHGVGALFSAAYGNVGSSIYYALGVTAAFALGLTPVAFVIAGLIFMATAATYAEATVMYPEAGGSASFARHAFNELVSFFAAWGQMLNYIITVSISAFFVPHYLAVFWPWLGDSPGDIIGGRRGDRLPRGAEREGDPGVHPAQPDPGDRRPLHPGHPGCDRARPGLQPQHPGRQRPPRRGAELGGLPARDRGGDDRLHRDRDDLEHVGGGQGRLEDDPEGGRADGRRRARPLRAAAADRPLGDACPSRRRPLLDGPRDQVRRRPRSRHRGEPGPERRAHQRPALLRRRPGRGDPADRHQRRADRRLPADLLDGPLPPAAGAAPAGPSQVPNALRRDPRLLRLSRSSP